MEPGSGPGPKSKQDRDQLSGPEMIIPGPGLVLVPVPKFLCQYVSFFIKNSTITILHKLKD